MSGGHWAVFLTLAQSYGWKPRGTKAPSGWLAGEKWGGRYDSSEGQAVTAQDAKQFATVLHAASVSDTLPVALGEVITHVEQQLVIELSLPGAWKPWDDAIFVPFGHD